MAANPLRQLFEKHTVADLPTPKTLIEVDSKAQLIDGFEALINNKIQSAPVYDATTHTYIGFLDVRDLVSFVRFVYDEQKVVDNQTLKDIVHHGVHMFKAPTTDGVTVSYLARRNKFSPLKPSATLLAVVELLSRGLHRVPILNDDGKLVNIISQSSIINYLDKHLHQLDTIAGATVESIKVGTHPAQSVAQTASVIDTLRLMDSKGLSGVAITGHAGRLVGITTGKDLGLFIKNPSLSTLSSPVFQFLAEIRDQAIDIRVPTIAVFPKDTLGRVIGVLAATKVHRVFLVDNETDYKPVAAISITDILRHLFKLCTS
jgi:CBS-domain-containing membrane protein